MSKIQTHIFHSVIFFSLILISFLGVRLFNLQEHIIFSSDAGRDFLVVRDIYMSHHVTLLGPPSEYKVEGREFFFGPAPYYVILPILVVSNWNPVIVSYFLIVINFVAFIYLLVVLYRYNRQPLVTGICALLFTLSPTLILYSQSYWNPYFILPISVCIVALLIRNIHKPYATNLFYIFILLNDVFL